MSGILRREVIRYIGAAMDRKKFRIPCSLFAGDEEVTKRVAERLKNYVHNCADRSVKETFVGVLNRFVAEVTREISLAPDEANETSDQLIATELGNSKTRQPHPLLRRQLKTQLVPL